MKLLKSFLLVLLLIFTWCIRLYHVGVYVPPPVPTLSLEPDSEVWKKGKWIDRADAGLNHLILEGSAYERGLNSGRLTQSIIKQQETELLNQFQKFFPASVIQRGFILTLIRWFWGIENYFEPWMIEEMYGVSQFTSSEFDYIANPLTRQVAYHGLHEVGQMMVDQTGDDMGCTVIAIPLSKVHRPWIIGRNFDFEGGRIFDEQKIVKWVFPDQGYAFVSVIWAGMVGAVTGVNEHGLYISINAAGSTDMRRYGTPSTLVLLKALQFSKTAKEAVELIRNSKMFITDIFVVSDRQTHQLFRVEKSPKHTEVIELTDASVVTNHLHSSVWKDDRINLFRKNELTSTYREERANSLLAHLKSSPNQATDVRATELQVLSFLRDKGEFEGQRLHPGNRRAIDALIATHAVIYNEEDHVLYISKGPSLAGEFLGFDLSASFKMKTPQKIRTLHRDPDISDDLYSKIKLAQIEELEAKKLIKNKKCTAAEALLKQAKDRFSEGHTENYTESYSYHTAYGDLLHCGGDHAGAKTEWKKALLLAPAYQKEIQSLERKLQ